MSRPVAGAVDSRAAIEAAERLGGVRWSAGVVALLVLAMGRQWGGFWCWSYFSQQCILD
jgi:hypothetical protein